MNDWTLPPDDDDAPPSSGPGAPPRRGFGGRGLGGGPRKPPRRIAWGLLSVVALVVVAILGAFAVAEAWVVRDLMPGIPEIPDRAALMVVNQTPGMTFQDANGAVIAQRGARHGHAVTLAELPPYVPKAFLAVEDKRFYSHGPVDVRGIIRAAWVNWRAHRTVQGGSTLTQQLAKTLFLTPDQTLKRKLQEAVIANRLEQVMTKDQVLELYLNRIFFGDNSYGIDAAAQTYFGKPASGLSLQEAALLAALPKAPTRLALTNDMPAALARSHIVLDHMRDEGWISVAQEQLALNQPPKLAPEAPGEGDYGYVLDMAAAQAVQIAGVQAPDLIVKLTIDPALQAQAQSIVKKTLAEQGPHAGASQGALVLIGPDGAIRALVGGTDHHLSAFNRVTQAQRQPGSSFKPFVYATALEEGLKPTDVRQDAPVRFGTWAPSNYEGGYRGPVTLAEALAHSINTVAVRVTSEVGTDKIAGLAHRFGLKSIPDQPNLALALGAYEVNLLELTSGYQVFQQGGQRTEPSLIQQISTARGQVLYAHAPSAGIVVYDNGKAADMVRMLEGVIGHGTGVRANFGRPAAGKTGTTSDYRDAWFVGFTPDWVCGVWVGNDDNSPMNHVTGGQLPADIWRQMMLAAHRDLPVRDFDWMPPPDAGEPGEQQAEADPAASDAEAPDEPARAEAGDQRKSFYGDLSNDFDQAAGADSHRREPPTDPAPQEEPRP